MKIDEDVLEALSPRSRSYIDSVLKLLEGQRLILEARMELGQLDGVEAKSRPLREVPLANYIASARAVKEEVRKEPVKETAKGPVPDMPIDLRVYAALANGPRTTWDIAAAANCSETYVRTLLKRPAANVERIEDGRSIKYCLKGRSGTTKVADVRPPLERVLAALKIAPSTAEELAKYTGLSPQYINKELRNHADVSRTRDGRSYTYTFKGAAAPAQVSVKGTGDLIKGAPGPGEKTLRGTPRIRRWYTSDTERQEAVLAAVKKYEGWASLSRLRMECGMREEVMIRTAKQLEKLGKLKRVTKTGGPFRTDFRVKNTPMAYWELA